MSAPCRWAPPVGWESYTVRNVPAGGGTLSLSNGTNYLLKSPVGAPIAGVVTITGGANVVWRGAFFQGALTAPALTSTYDSTARGVRITSSSGSPNRIIFFEGFKSIAGTYHSDLVQFYSAGAPISGMTFYFQNIRAESWNWGNNVTSPNVHADLVQFYSGPTNVFMDRIDAKKGTYQGLYLDSNNFGGTPGGTKVPWEFRNIQLFRETVGGTGQPSGVSCALNTAASFAGGDMIQENVYVKGFKNISVFGAWPADVQFHEGVVPPGGDFTDPADWNDATFTYNPPGYVGVTGPDASVSATAGSILLPSTSHTIRGGARVAGVAGSLALPSTSPVITGLFANPPGTIKARVRAGV